MSILMATRLTMVLSALAHAVHAGSPSKPDIIFILSDDLGYGDYSLSTEVNESSFRLPTPNIERLAVNGVKFTRGYSMQVCAPSRCTLMTGRHLGHCSIRGNDGAYSPLLETDVSIAKVMKRAGYRTGIVGKWGLGNFNTTGYPLAQGFDYYVGQSTQVGCHDWYPLTVDNNTDHTYPLNTETALDHSACLGPSPQCIWANDLCKEQGIEFIRNAVQAKQNYFLYVSTTTPHAGEILGSGKNPAWYADDYPVPYEYSQRFLNHTSAVWTNEQTQFAAAVWAQDKIVGDILDELESLSMTESTIVFFSGDNGPDGHPFELMDDTGVFRGKKRSLHEGGIRQTIVAHWPGTIVGNQVSDTLFTFYDVLPTAADLAGLDRAEWGPTDGVSIKSVLMGSDENVAETINRYIYLEFCHNANVDGLLPQTYTPGWVQAIRWDDNQTQFRTEWKGIRSNSDSRDFLLYNITDDQSESGPLLSPNKSECSAACMRARKIILTQMEEAHVENEFWPSAKNSSDKCCNSCFNPSGCPAPCKMIGPPQPPPPPSPPTPIDQTMLNGVWRSANGNTFELSVDGSSETVTLIAAQKNQESCWTTANGKITENNTVVSVVATGPRCTHNRVGRVSKTVVTKVIDVQYVYKAPAVTIAWDVNDKDTERDRWTTWTKRIGEFVIEL